MKPRAVFVGWRPVEKHHFAGVPTLVRLLYIGQVERSEAVWRVLGDSSHSAFVSRTAVSGIVVIPNEYRYVETLKRTVIIFLSYVLYYAWNFLIFRRTTVGR